MTRREALLQLLRGQALRNILVGSHFIRVHLAFVGVPLLSQQHPFLLHAADAVGHAVTCAAKPASMIHRLLLFHVRLVLSGFSRQCLRFLIIGKAVDVAPLIGLGTVLLRARHCPVLVLAASVLARLDDGCVV